MMVTPVLMVALALLTWAMVAASVGAAVHRELLYGMLGPLVATVGTWVAVERVFRMAPARVTGVMVAGLGIKAVFFGAYVAVVLLALDVRPIPFVVSFTGYFVALYGLEALLFKRLFAGGGARAGQ
jgi:hypothetical protein